MPLFQKFPLKKNSKSISLALIFLFLLTGAFYLYQGTGYVKGEYQRICNANETLPQRIELCLKPYWDEFYTLELALKVEIALVVVSILLFYYSKRK